LTSNVVSSTPNGLTIYSSFNAATKPCVYCATTPTALSSGRISRGISTPSTRRRTESTPQMSGRLRLFACSYGWIKSCPSSRSRPPTLLRLLQNKVL
uniref:Ovule protein n=1 Tax=Schistocephalus solidus TaxID=70667 RepID=A0A183TLE9_SCHSO